MIVLSIHHLRLLSTQPQIVVISVEILVVTSILRIRRDLYFSVVVGAFLHWRITIIGSSFLAEKLILVAQDIHFHHVVLFQVSDFIIERLHLDNLDTVNMLLSLLFLLPQIFAILFQLVDFVLHRLNLSIFVLTLSLQILAHVLKLFDCAIEITENTLLLILLHNLVFLDFLLALIHVLLELIQKL